ncbi:MAG: hypothetical protein ACOYJ6_19270 [Caulobacterales bacterium]|jgi:hypothetical protein
MTDATIQTRELELRERELKLEEQKMERARRASILDWVKGLALPIASLIASLFFFAVQQQQQAFERALGNVREGLKLYYEQVGQIERTAQDDRLKIELATDVFSSTVRIYPEVYCSARSDLLERISAAGMAVTDQDAARRKVIGHGRPSAREGLGSPRWHFVTTMFEPTMPPCEALNEQPPGAAKAAPAAPFPQAEMPAPGPAPAETAAGAAPPPEARLRDAPAAAAEPQAPVFRASQVYRIFVQVGSGSTPAVVDAWRDEVNEAGFTMMRRVQEVGRPLTSGTVRYNGQGARGGVVKADAEMLAAWLSTKTGQPIAALDIGDKFPNLREDFLEVWLPDPPAASAKKRPGTP